MKGRFPFHEEIPQKYKGDLRTCAIFIPVHDSNWRYTGLTLDQYNCDSSYAYVLWSELEDKHAYGRQIPPLLSPIADNAITQGAYTSLESPLYIYGIYLGWFQTSLPLAALQLRRVIIACHFRVTALSGHTALAFSMSGVTLKLTRSQCLWFATLDKAARLPKIGKTLFTAWSSLCGKWLLHSCTNITIKAAT